MRATMRLRKARNGTFFVSREFLLWWNAVLFWCAGAPFFLTLPRSVDMITSDVRRSNKESRHYQQTPPSELRSRYRVDRRRVARSAPRKVIGLSNDLPDSSVRPRASALAPPLPSAPRRTWRRCGAERAERSSPRRAPTSRRYLLRDPRY